jgi:4-amino-4-deoxy-L-arabinose transferase-like glycosyltransferase
MTLKRFLKKWKRALLILSIILAVGFILRIYNLNELPIFGDEAIYVRWSQIMRAEPGLRFVSLSDGKQPLFMWTMIPFLKLFNDPLYAGRFVSALFGMGTVVGLFLLSYLLFKSQKVSLISSLFWIFTPLAVFFDRMALVDASLSFYGIWALIFSIITVRKVRLDTAMLAGFALGGALLTKSPAIYFAVLIPFTLILGKWPKKFKDKFNKLSVYVFLFFFTYAIGIVMYNIQRLGENFQMLALRNQDYVYPLSHLLTSPLDPLVPFLQNAVEWFWLMGPGIFLLLVFIGIFHNLKKFPKEIILLSLWAFLPLIISAEFAKVFTARYILFTIPYFVIIAASVFTSGRYKLIFNIFLVIFLIQAIYTDFLYLTNVEAAPLPQGERSGYLEEWTAGTGIKESADYIRGVYRSNLDEKIVVGTEGYFGTLPDGLQIYLNDIPQITVIGVGIDLKTLPNSLKESADAGNDTYLVINASRLVGKPDDMGLKLIHIYPKAFRKPGTKQYNLLGPRDNLYLFKVTNKQ